VIDAGVIAAYLAAAVARGAERLLGRVVDGALDRLADSVARRLGPRPAADLEPNPYDSATLAEISRAIDAVARRDAGFARELAALRRELDSHGGGLLVNQVRARTNVQAFGGGNAAGRDYHEGDYYKGDHYQTTNDYDPGDELISGRGPGQVLAWVGLVVLLSGFAGFAFVVFTGFVAGATGPLDLELIQDRLPLLPAAFGAFLVGGLMYGFGASISKAARKREQERRRAVRRRPGQRRR
jgi:hypothetical protein